MKKKIVSFLNATLRRNTDKGDSPKGEDFPGVVMDLDFDLRAGETIGIAGASAVVKSTLLHILGTLDRPDSGILRFNEDNLFDYPDDRLAKFRNESIGFVFQFHHLLAE